MWIYNCKSAVQSTVTGSSQTLTLIMKAHKQYAYMSNTNSWITQDASANNPTAAIGNGCTYVPAGSVITLDGAFGDTLAVIRDTASGNCSLTPIVRVD